MTPGYELVEISLLFKVSDSWKEKKVGSLKKLHSWNRQ